MNLKPLKILCENLTNITKKNNPITNEKATSAQVTEVVYIKPTNKLYTFLVKGGQKYSSASGHLVNILFTDAKIRKNANLSKVNMKVTCSCPAFTYSGVAYNATRGGYNLGNKEKRKPDKRDPKRINKACKHIVAIYPYINKLKLEASGKVSWNNPAVQEVLENEVSNLFKNFKGCSTSKEFGELMYNLTQI